MEMCHRKNLYQVDLLSSSKTIAYVQEHHYDTRESLQMSFEEVSEKWKESKNAKYFKEYQKELRTVCSNVDSILGRPHTLEADRTQYHTIS